MLPTVHLDDEAPLTTNKIHCKASDRLLPNELESSQPS
jgi:hypothetical protein